MSASLMRSSPFRFRFVGALLMIFALGCGGLVDLGHTPPSPPSPPPDAGPADDGSAATLLRFNDSGCLAVGADDTHLYLSTFEADGPSVHRCRKTNCAATLTRVARPPCATCFYSWIERIADRIAFASIASEFGAWGQIAACTPPDCSDLQKVAGEFADLNSAAFAGNQVYFSIGGDNSINVCGFPSCPEGPRALVRGSWSDQLATTREWVYWIDRAGAVGTVKRKLRDGSSAVETLDLGTVLGPAAGGSTGPNANVVHRIAAHDGWLYAVIANPSDGDLACSQPGQACVIARWPDDALGKPRELVYRSTAPISHHGGALEPYQSRIRLVDGRLVFTADQGYSCDPANCVPTIRTHQGINADRMASDGEYFYWCATDLPGGQGELRRSARLR
jgi:hypothetical protein